MPIIKYMVVPIEPSAQHSQKYRGGFSITTRLGNRDLLTTFFTSKQEAVVVAQKLAQQNPGNQYGVTELGAIYEAQQPVVIEKKQDDHGQVIVVGECTPDPAPVNVQINPAPAPDDYNQFDFNEAPPPLVRANRQVLQDNPRVRLGDILRGNLRNEAQQEPDDNE